MATTDKTSVNFKALVDELERRELFGDCFAGRCLAALALLAEGWRYGDPDPPNDGGPDGGEPPPGGEQNNITVLEAYRKRGAV